MRILPSVDSTMIDPAPRRIGELPAVGPVAYGCWRFAGTDVPTARAKIEAALDAGLTLVDTADVYGLDDGLPFGAAEALLGEVLTVAPQLRDRMVLATKGGIRPPVPYDSSPTWLRTAVEDSLRRLRVEVIDLWQVHRPDLYTHPAALAEVLVALRDEGKVREVGVSNTSPSQVEALIAHLPFPLATIQSEFSLWCWEVLDDGTLDQAMRLGAAPLAWSPLAGGRLATGVGLDACSDPDRGRRILAVLDELAEREGVARWQVALAWVLAHPSRPVAIVGTQDLERIEAAAAAASIRIDRADAYRLLAAAGRDLP